MARDGVYEEWWDGAWLGAWFGAWDGACDGLERAVKEWSDRGVSGRSSSRRSWYVAKISIAVAAATLDAAFILAS